MTCDRYSAQYLLDLQSVATYLRLAAGELEHVHQHNLQQHDRDAVDWINASLDDILATVQGLTLEVLSNYSSSIQVGESVVINATAESADDAHVRTYIAARKLSRSLHEARNDLELLAVEGRTPNRRSFILCLSAIEELPDERIQPE